MIIQKHNGVDMLFGRVKNNIIREGTQMEGYKNTYIWRNYIVNFLVNPLTGEVTQLELLERKA